MENKLEDLTRLNSIIELIGDAMGSGEVTPAVLCKGEDACFALHEDCGKLSFEDYERLLDDALRWKDNEKLSWYAAPHIVLATWLAREHFNKFRREAPSGKHAVEMSHKVASVLDAYNSLMGHANDEYKIDLCWCAQNSI